MLMGTPIRETSVSIVLADDHAVMRSGLRVLLDAEPDLDVRAEAGDILSGFVRKHAAASDLVRAIRTAASGGTEVLDDGADPRRYFGD